MTLARAYTAIAAALLMVTASVVPSSAGPSYDCRKAAIPAEHAICESDHLSALDRILADRYRDLTRDGGSAFVAELRSGQRRWLQLRNGCGWNYNCLAGVYHLRMGQLGL